VQRLFLGRRRRAFVRAALTKVGCGRAVVVGYFRHEFQAAAMGLMPESAQRMGLIIVMRPFKGKNLDSEGW
jgi:17beta-estradiol 17-dehydrogenase / very-long-chain 3-oxoacyl-CoA reductase